MYIAEASAVWKEHGVHKSFTFNPNLPRALLVELKGTGI